MIEVVEIKEKKDFVAFVEFPFQLYKNCPYWVPPMKAEELTVIDKDQNPVFKNADAAFYLAYNDGKIVGRIAAIINWIEVDHLQKRKVRFGWFDVIDDLEVSRALIEAVKGYGTAASMEFMEGPVGFSNLDKAGMKPENLALKVSKCCETNKVVGTNIATCLPSWMALKAALRATSVLP